MTALLLAALLAQEPGPDPAPPEEPPAEPWSAHVEPASGEAERALEGFEPFEGFEVRLFAAEPRLANPVCLYVDDRGGVWVAETFRHFEGVTDMRDHTGWLDEDLASRTVGDRLAMLARHEGAELSAYRRASERVHWLADTDGDGRADVDAVFAEGFDAPEAGIGAGLLVHGRDVYYTCIPDLWRLGDDDGNRRADRREVLSTGYGVNVALLGHDLHGLRVGPDGKLYFSCGDRGFHVETPEGVLDHAHTGAVLRCELDGSGLEVFATGLRNPQELVFDELGNLWTGDNNSDGGDEARWVQVVEGSDSGWRYSYQWLTEPVLRGPWNEERLWHPRHEGQAAYIVPPVANLASGPSGLTYDPGTGLPPALARHFFLCDFRGDPAYSGIHAFTVEPEPDGAGFVLGPVERLLWNVLPTDVDFGPDGSLYVSDWVDGWNKTGKGRVYRLFVPGALAPDTAALLGAGAAGKRSDELAALLGHADRRVRQMAQEELVARGEHALLLEAAGPVADLDTARLRRLHGLWGAGRLGADVTHLAADRDSQVRAQACRVLGDAGCGADPGVHATLARALADEHPRVRMHAAIALGKHPGAGGPELLAALSDFLERDGRDPVLRHAAVMALVGLAAPDWLAGLAGHASREVRLGAVVALRRLRDPGVARFLGDADPLVVLEAARAIHDVPIPAAQPALAALARGAGEEPLERALGRRVLAALHRQHDQAAARALLAFAGREGEEVGLRAEALSLVRAWARPGGRDPVTGAWRPVDEARLEDTAYLGAAVAEAFERTPPGAAPDDVQLEWIALLDPSRPSGSSGHLPAAGASEWLERRAFDAGASEAVRVRALEALVGERGDGDAVSLVALLERALLDPSGGVRAVALGRLGRLDPEQAFPLIETAATRGETAERRAAYGLLAGSERAEAEVLLADELGRLLRGELPPEVALELVRAARERGGERLEALLAERTAGREDERTAPFLDGLYGGDRERGRQLFRADAELQCLRCHTTGEEQDQATDRPAIGPTLAGLGSRSTRLETLTSIVDPNRTFAGDFRGTLFFLADGGRLEGQVVEERADGLSVLDAEGELHELAPDQIEARRPGLSAMPDGLGGLIEPGEMRDLLEFLSGL